MAKAADIGSKRLISLAPGAWVRWLLGEEEMPQVELIGSEFQWVSRTGDMLMKVNSEQHGTFLIAKRSNYGRIGAWRGACAPMPAWPRNAMTCRCCRSS